MNTFSSNQILSVLIMALFLVSCQINSDQKAALEKMAPSSVDSTSKEEAEIIHAVENILKAAGNYNTEELDRLTTDKAVIGYTKNRDGVWKNTEVTINEFLEGIQNRELKPYLELVNDYDIILTEERMALVRADAVSNRFGIPSTREINHMIFIKDDMNWKLLSIAWTAQKLTEEKKRFNLDLFAQGYAQAWGSNRPGFVAQFFEEDGSLQVNDGDTAIGRTSISDVAQGFMTQFPDMNLGFDSLVHKAEGVEFHWTLTGTDSDPKGKGHKVKISGFELWTMSEGNLIKESKGTFSSEEYKRQLEFGVHQ